MSGIEIYTLPEEIEVLVDDPTEVIEIELAAGISGPPGLPGREVELSTSSTHIRWRYVGDSTWINLVALADLEGLPGEDGREVEFGAGGTHLRWRYVNDGTTPWTNLISWANLTGPEGPEGPEGLKGDKGDKGDQGDSGVVLVTQAQYDALPTPRPSDVLYAVVG